MTASTAPERTGFRFSDLRKMFGGGGNSALRQFGILGALIVIIAFFEIFTGGKTLQTGNVLNIINANAYVLVLAIGMVMVIIAGHIDLSVGSIAAAVGIVVAISMRDWHFPPLLAILLGLAIGAVIGAWQGFWVAYVGIPAFIVTLAGMLLFRGFNQFFGNSQTVPVPQGFAFIGNGYIPDFGPATPFSNGTLLIGVVAIVAVVVQELRLRAVQRRMGADHAPLWVSVLKIVLLVAVIGAATYLVASGPAGTSLPISGIIVIVLVIGYSFLTSSTVLGRHVYAVGGNWRAAELSGVKIRRINFFVMMNMSILAALAGMIGVARSVASGPNDATGWELDAIAAVFIGGAAVSGGIGTVIGSIIGALVIAVLNNGLALMGVSSDKVQMIKGIVLLLAVAIDVLSKVQGRPSLVSRLGWGRNRRPDDRVDGADGGGTTVLPDGGRTPENPRPADLSRQS